MFSDTFAAKVYQEHIKESNQTGTLEIAELRLERFSPTNFINPLSCVQLDAQQHRLRTVIGSDRG